EPAAPRAPRLSHTTPALIRALGTVRHQIDELTMLGATAPRATLGQRVYATRRRTNLTIAETAQAAGVSEDDVARAEAEEPVPAASIDAIGALLKQIN